jgi:hypothetical protein
MELIPEEIVEKTWQGVAGFSPIRANKEIMKIGNDQSELLAFITASTEEMGQEVKELGIYMTFSVICLSLAADYKYVGSSKSNKYHYPDCKWALKIKTENLVTFKSAKDALVAGYIPCKVRRPSAKD